jgi:death-on-curing family protein
MSKIIYPSEDMIVAYNSIVLKMIKVKKADKSEIMSYEKIQSIVQECKKYNGDIYDKAAVLMTQIIQKHAFASGNRRTAFIATKDFVLQNKGKFEIKNTSVDARVLQGIRERYYTHNEIKEWIKNGKIKKFER